MPFLAGFVYLALLRLEVDPAEAWLPYCLWLFYVLGMASFGYLLNDIADIRPDARAGKTNAAAGMKPVWRLPVLLLLLGMAALPWFYYGADALLLALLTAHVLLFLLYSLPPVRLKDRGFWGAFADSLYAFVVPLSISAYAFFFIFGHTGALKPELLVSFTAWAVLIGLRNITRHQQEDAEGDKRSGTRTWALRISPGRLKRLQILFMSIEIAAFLVFLYLFGLFQLYFMSAFALYIVLWIATPQKIYLNQYYEYWFPLVALVVLALARDLWYLAALPVHVLLYRHKYIFILFAEACRRSLHALIWAYYHILAPAKSFFVHLAYFVYWELMLKPTVKLIKATISLLSKKANKK